MGIVGAIVIARWSFNLMGVTGLRDDVAIRQRLKPVHELGHLTVEVR